MKLPTKKTLKKIGKVLSWTVFIILGLNLLDLLLEGLGTAFFWGMAAYGAVRFYCWDRDTS